MKKQPYHYAINKSVRHFIWYYYKPFVRLIVLYALCAVLIGLHGFLISYMIKILVNCVQDSGHMRSYFMIYAMCLIMCFELHNICWRVIRYLNAKIAPVIKRHITEDAFVYVHGHSMQYLHRHGSAYLAHHITMLANQIDKLVSQVGLRIIRGVVQIVVALLSMCILSTYFGAGFMIWMTAFIGLSVVYAKKVVSKSKKVAGDESVVSAHIVDSLAHAVDVKAASSQLFEKNFISDFLKRYQASYQQKEWFLIRYHLLQGLSITVFIGFILVVLNGLYITGGLNIGDFAFLLTLVFYLTENVWNFSEQFNDINDAYGGILQAMKVIYRDDDRLTGHHTEQSMHIQQGLVFDHVRFKYNNGSEMHYDRKIEVPLNQKIGLVGHTGAGKTTFVNLLTRIFDPCSGQISIDGKNVRDLDSAYLNSLIATVPQDVSLFNRSILENITYGLGDINFSDVVETAKMVHIHDFIMGLPQGYQTVVAERGARLSGGQRQRVAIARAILKDAPILILDEATCHLDVLTERAINHVLLSFIKQKTAIIIAHRLSTVVELDRILVFDKGKIIADGQHETLLHSCESYRSLWDSYLDSSSLILKSSEA